MTIAWTRPDYWDKPGTPPKGGDSRRILDFIDRIAQAKPVEAAYKLTSTSINSGSGGTTFTNDPHLSFDVSALEVVRVKLSILYDAGTVGDMKCRFLLPSGTMYNSSFENAASAYTQLSDGNAQITGLAGTGVGNRFPLRVEGTLEVGSTGGVVNWQWAQDAADASNTTVARGGMLEIIRLA